MFSGNEYVALVEFAPNQKINNQKESKKKDPKMNTIEQDPDYIKFLEMLEKKPEVHGALFSEQFSFFLNLE